MLPSKSAQARQLTRAIHNYQIKYPYVINAGFLGEASGIEVVFHRYIIHDGKKGILVDPKRDSPFRGNLPGENHL